MCCSGVTEEQRVNTWMSWLKVSVAWETLTAAFLEDQGLHLGQLSLPLQELLSPEIRQGPWPVSSAAPCGERRGNKSLTMQKIESREVLIMSTAKNQERSLSKMSNY